MHSILHIKIYLKTKIQILHSTLSFILIFQYNHTVTAMNLFKIIYNFRKILNNVLLNKIIVNVYTYKYMVGTYMYFIHGF